MANINPSLILDWDTCEIRVDREASTRSYHVHRGLLYSKATYFRGAHTLYNTQTHSPVYIVEDANPEALRSFITWLYTAKVYFGNEEVFEPEKIEVGVMDLEPDESWGETDGQRDTKNYPDLEDVAFDEEADEEADEKAVQLDEEMSDSELPEPQERNTFEYAVWRVWPYTKPDDLDAYQVRVLLRLADKKVGGFMPEEEENLRSTLSKKEKVKPEADIHATFENPPLAYDRLIDLYILAHRFEAPELCDLVITLLQAEHDEQQAILGGRPLPSYELVARVYDAAPKGSTLRDWLLNIYTCNSKSVSLSAETTTAMEELPKEFLTHLLLAHSQTSFGQMAEDWSVDSHSTRRAR